MKRFLILCLSLLIVLPLLFGCKKKDAFTEADYAAWTAPVKIDAVPDDRPEGTVYLTFRLDGTDTVYRLDNFITVDTRELEAVTFRGGKTLSVLNPSDNPSVAYVYLRDPAAYGFFEKTVLSLSYSANDAAGKAPGASFRLTEANGKTASYTVYADGYVRRVVDNAVALSATALTGEETAYLFALELMAYGYRPGPADASFCAFDPAADRLRIRFGEGGEKVLNADESAYLFNAIVGVVVASGMPGGARAAYQLFNGKIGDEGKELFRFDILRGLAQAIDAGDAELPAASPDAMYRVFENGAVRRTVSALYLTGGTVILTGSFSEICDPAADCANASDVLALLLAPGEN